MTMNGKAIAMTVAGLLLAVGPHVANADDKTKEAKVKCSGINSCKGTSSCKTASSSCKGLNSCKGMGWSHTTSASECTSKGGKVI